MDPHTSDGIEILPYRSPTIMLECTMRTAIVHDWLTSPGGAERVLEQMLISYPDADVFTICDFLERKHRGILHGKIPHTSFIQNLPFARKLHKLYLPLMPLAIEQLDLSSYDLVISSSYAVAKGVITGPDQLHVSYIHTPIRYAWHMQSQYLHESHMDNGVRSWFARAILHYMRTWDLSSAAGVDVFISNSEYVAKQVRRLYRRECEVLYPPIDIDELPFSEEKSDFFLTASRLVPYKRIDLIVKAFAQMPTRRLIVVGEGPERERVEAAAQGHKNIEIRGYETTEKLHRLMSRARAFVFAAIEDFGIAPVEAQACGTPVIALGKGGALESIRPLGSDFPTGIFFTAQTEWEIIAAVESFEHEELRIRPRDCRANAERFRAERFREGLSRIVLQHMRPANVPVVAPRLLTVVAS
jgi:glycosyltransferase involved in cell wall biosynthesis